MRFAASIVLAAAVGGVSGFVAWHWLFDAGTGPRAADPLSDPRFVALVPDRPPPADERLIGAVRPDFELTDLAGRTRRAADFDGQVVLVNFWATWCAPCREEMPMLVDLQRRHGPRGLLIIGPALDDEAAVRAFAERYAIDYPLLLGETPVMALGRAYGNRAGGIPYTALVGRDGRIVYLKAGLLKASELEPRIEQALR